MTRAVVLAVILGLALPAGAAMGGSKGFSSVATLHDPDEATFVVVVGPRTRSERAISVNRKVRRPAYRAAWSSAPDPRSRRREANAFAFHAIDRQAFEPFGGLPLRVGIGGFGGGVDDDRMFRIDVPYVDGRADLSAVRATPMPRFARRALNRLIDTSTGEIAWD